MTYEECIEGISTSVDRIMRDPDALDPERENLTGESLSALDVLSVLDQQELDLVVEVATLAERKARAEAIAKAKELVEARSPRLRPYDWSALDAWARERDER